MPTWIKRLSARPPANGWMMRLILPLLLLLTVLFAGIGINLGEERDNLDADGLGIEAVWPARAGLAYSQLQGHHPKNTQINRHRAAVVCDAIPRPPSHSLSTRSIDLPFFVRIQPVRAPPGVS